MGAYCREEDNALDGRYFAWQVFESTESVGVVGGGHGVGTILLTGL